MARGRRTKSVQGREIQSVDQAGGGNDAGLGDAAARRIAVEVIREPAMAPMTPRKRQVCWDYGIPPREAPYVVGENVSLSVRPGSIVLLAGPSGSGKSTLLHAVSEHAADALWVSSRWPSCDRPGVDSIAPRKPLGTALEILTACGLGEPRLWVRQYRDLSDGEKFRACLARAVGEALSRAERPVILCDEFATMLHRRLARCISHNLRKLVDRHRLSIVLATTRDDLVEDLKPDQRIDLGANPSIDGGPRGGDVTSPLIGGLRIEKGCVRDYESFSPMHYRHRDGLGFVDQVFVLRDRLSGEALGVLVTAHAPLELAQRNAATNGRFIRNPRRLNRELRIIRRLVMHPDVRGCGLGHWFVRKALPRVGVRFVECLAAMGEVNPIFERAGMVRVGRCSIPKGRLKLVARLAAMKIDPFASDFGDKVARCSRVRKMVEETVRVWTGAMHGNMRFKVSSRSSEQLSQTFLRLIGSPPVYYLWDRDGVYPMNTMARRKPESDSANKTAAEGNSSRDPETSRTNAEKDRHRPSRS